MLTVSCDPSLSTLKRGMTLVKLRAFDESGTCDVTFFNQPYMRAQLQKGQEYRFSESSHSSTDGSRSRRRSSKK